MLSVVHNYYYLLALLLIHSLRTSICVCKYLYMLSTTFDDREGRANDPDFSVNLTRPRATFHTPEILYIMSRNYYTSQGDPDSSFSLWGAEAWGMRSTERRKVNVLEMKCLRSLVGVLRMDRVRNEEVQRRAGIERELASRADWRVLRWFGHVERMDEYRMARRVLMAEVNERWVRVRPRLGWMDGVKVALGNRGVAEVAVRQCTKAQKAGRALVHM